MKKQDCPTGLLGKEFIMKANGRFFGVMFIFNLICGTLGFLILWGIRAMTDNSPVGIVVFGVIAAVFAAYVNFFIVKKSKLKTLYFLYGTFVNLIFLAVFTALTMIF